MKWLNYKSHIDTSENSPHPGRLLPYYQGHYEALKNYNANALNGLPKGVDYANDVMNKAWASYGDWQK